MLSRTGFRVFLLVVAVAARGSTKSMGFGVWGGSGHHSLQGCFSSTAWGVDGWGRGILACMG